MRAESEKSVFNALLVSLVLCVAVASGVEAADSLRLFEEGLDHGQEGRYAEAVETLGQVLEREPEFAQAWAYKGRAYYHLGQHEEAISAFASALALSPDLAVAREGMEKTMAETDRDELPSAHRLDESPFDMIDEPAETFATERQADIETREARKRLMADLRERREGVVRSPAEAFDTLPDVSPWDDVEHPKPVSVTDPHYIVSEQIERARELAEREPVDEEFPEMDQQQPPRRPPEYPQQPPPREDVPPMQEPPPPMQQEPPPMQQEPPPMQQEPDDFQQFEQWE